MLSCCAVPVFSSVWSRDQGMRSVREMGCERFRKARTPSMGPRVFFLSCVKRFGRRDDLASSLTF